MKKLRIQMKAFAIGLFLVSLTIALSSGFSVAAITVDGINQAPLEYVYHYQFGTLGSGNGQFRSSTGVAIDPTSHNIVVIDAELSRVQIFNSDGVYQSQFGRFGSGNGQFNAPEGVAIDPTSHNIVVTDAELNRVQIFNSAGVYQSQFGTLGFGKGQFYYGPTGVAIDPTSHNIVVIDLSNSRVQIFNSDGVYQSQFGTFGSGDGQFGAPYGVAIDPTSHNIVVTDAKLNRVQIFNSAGVYQSQFGTLGSGDGQFGAPYGVAIDPTSHNIVVTDLSNSRVQIFNSAGVYQSQFGRFGSGNGQFIYGPVGVAIDPTSHNIVVTDAELSRVEIFALAAPGLTALNPAVWVGLKNSDDVGTRFDLLAEVFKNGTSVPIGRGQLNNVAGGSSGFNNALLNTIPLDLTGGAVYVCSGDTLKIKVSVRRTCFGAGHASGTARLWFNDAQADTGFDATIGDTNSEYFLLSGSAVGSEPGSGPKKTIDIFVDSKFKCPDRPFIPFGTWSIVLP